MIGREEAAVRGALLVSFITGFFLGYKAKEWRIRWLKFRRDRLARKLADTQKLLDIQAPAI